MFRNRSSFYEKKIGDLYASVYERAMHSDRRIYKRICKRISHVVKDKDEPAAGKGSR